MHVQSNFTNLPVELVCIIMSSFTFKTVAKCAEINKSMAYNVDFVMMCINAINDKISVDSIDYVVKKCRNIKLPPYICGNKNYDIYSMRKLLRRWPSHLSLNWDMTSPRTMSTFLQSISKSNFRKIKHMSLKVVDIKQFVWTQIYFNYMKLSSMRIDAEGCDLETILRGINCRSWRVDELYIRGDVTDLGALMLYAPLVLSKITIINTNDNMDYLSMGTEIGIRYITTIKNVHLCNIVKICCPPPNLCQMSNLFIYAVTTPIAPHATWTIDRLTVDMIEALVTNDITVNCGVFESEMKMLKELQIAHPNRLFIETLY